MHDSLRRRGAQRLARPLAALAALLLAACGPFAAGPRPDGPAAQARARLALQDSLQHALDSLRTAAHIPGLTLGVVLRDGRTIALASGESDTTAHLRMLPSARMLQGSVGKTYVVALAMRLVSNGQLDLDARIERYLGQEPWFNRLPNARDITVRELMQHTSGLVGYESQPDAAALVRAQPFKVWTPLDRLRFVFDRPAPFRAGEGWEYSDTNYIVLGMILERLLHTPYYTAVSQQILEPLELHNTIPSDDRLLRGVVNGYAGPHNALGGYDASIVNGLLQVNPQIEWTGGGMASTADDLARWGKFLYEGDAFDSRYLPLMTTGIPAGLGPGTLYGLGVIIRRTAQGELWGDSGVFPGYASEMLYNPRTGISVAVQANISDPYPESLVPFAMHALEMAAAAAPPAAGSLRSR